MARKPKARDGLTAGQRVALYEAMQKEKRDRMLEEEGGERISKPRADLYGSYLGGKGCDTDVKKAQKKKELPRPQRATVKVDLSMPLGKVKAVHGMCNGPVSSGADISHLFEDIGVPFVRFGEQGDLISPLCLPVQKIFADPYADPQDPENYDFVYSDRCVEAACKLGAKIIYRFDKPREITGVSSSKIDVAEKRYEMLDAWARVCVNVIKHYNAGWGNGFSFGIERFEIQIDDNSDISSGFETYKKLSDYIKIYDDGIKVGGVGIDARDSKFKEFLRLCKKRSAPVDFVTVTSFASSPEELVDGLKTTVGSLKNLGFDNTEVILGEWSYIGERTGGIEGVRELLCGRGGQNALDRKDFFGEQSSVKGAAYALSAMLDMNSIPVELSACFYNAEPATSPFCAVSDRFGNPEKTFYAFKAYGELYRAQNSVFSVCEQLEGYCHNGIHAGAAASGSGKCFVLVSSYKGCGTVDVRLDGIPDSIYNADIYILDGVKNLEFGDSVAISGSQKRIVLNISEYGAILIKLH